LPAKEGSFCLQHRQITVNTITREPLHLAWWNFAQTCIQTTSRF